MIEVCEKFAEFDQASRSASGVNGRFALQAYATVMGFPLAISGRVILKRADVIVDEVVGRLHDALIAQTVDDISVAGCTIHFKPLTKGNYKKPRPEGNGWMFGDLGLCELNVREGPSEVVVAYQLATNAGFYVVTAISISAATLIHLDGGPDSEWGWLFGLGFWTVMFLSTNVSKKIEVRGWIRSNLTSAQLPPTKRLSVPSDPG